MRLYLSTINDLCESKEANDSNLETRPSTIREDLT